MRRRGVPRAGRAARDVADGEAVAIVGLVTSAKLDAETPLAKAKPIRSLTVSRALSRFTSVSGEGVAVTVGRGRTSTWTSVRPDRRRPGSRPRPAR